MGAGFTVPQGMYWADKAATACGDADATNGKAKTKPKLRCGFVGDSTFFASGITGVINAVYNRAPVVLFVLDNSTTAMTGSQPHPGTGIRISYDASISDAENAISIPGILKACGVGHVTTCDPLDFSAAVAAAKEAAKYTSDNGAISAVVYKSPCITVCKAQPQPYVNDKCTQCRICIDMLGCPAITMGESAIDIDKSLCYGCDLCVQVCPSDAIKSTHICGAGDVADKAESGTPQCGDVR
jgi:indolepyruvate ferredoxin oxidoreductase alpha subunit